MDDSTKELMKVKGLLHKDIGPECARAEWEADDSHELSDGTSFPGAPTEKDFFYRTDEHKWYFYNGTDWINTVMD